MAEPEEVIDFLGGRSLEYLQVAPDRVHISHDGTGLTLQVSNGAVHEYPIRKCFLMKLLKWYSFPVTKLRYLNIETVTSILNDFLLGIRSGDVTVTIEDGEALTITSNRFCRLPDLDVLEMCKPLGIGEVSRNDFFTRVYTKVKVKEEIIKGDDCGFGYNVLNSETGFRVLSMHHYILRYTCSNGAMVRIHSEGDERAHYGYRPEELTRWLETLVAAGEKKRSGLVKSLIESTTKTFEADRDKLEKKLTAVVGKPKGHEIRERIGDGLSVYDVFNLLTDQAKQFDVGRRLQVEAIAGELLVEHRTE